MYAQPIDSLSSAGRSIIRQGLSTTPRPQAPARRQRTSTKLAYERDVGRFIRSFGGTIPCSANDLVSYITQQIKRVAPATVLRRLMAIQDAHNRAGHPSPTADQRIREAMRWLDAGQAPANLMIKPGKKRNQGPAIEPVSPPTSL